MRCRGRDESSLLPVWLPGGKAAPDGLGQRARGHRERIAEGRNQSYVGSVTGKASVPWGYGGALSPSHHPGKSLRSDKKGAMMARRVKNGNRGYFGIGVMLPKTEMNIGTLLRSAQAFGADFCFTIGKRYRRQNTDTSDMTQHTPLYHYETVEEFFAGLPVGCAAVAVEVDGKRELGTYTHLPRAAYILGPEDGSIPRSIRDRTPFSIRIPTAYCLNVAVAGSIVMYDRVAKQPRP